MQVQPLATAVGFQTPSIAFFDPSVGRHGVVLGMNRIQKKHFDVVFFLFHERFVITNEFFLGIDIRVTRYELGFFERVSKSMQQIGHTADRVLNREGLLDVFNDSRRSQVDRVCLKSQLVVVWIWMGGWI